MLFILAVETLAVAIRVQAGIQIEQEHRFSLYANYFFFKQICQYSQFNAANYSSSTSTTPSQLFLNKEERLQPVIKTPFINTKEGFICLGTNLIKSKL